MTTAHNDTMPSSEELELWTSQTRDWFNKTGKKRISSELKADLAAQGAKYCYTCQTAKAVTEFSKHSKMADGLNSRCRPCNNGAAAEYYAEHAEERRAYDRAYHAANREKRNEDSRRYYAEHREELREFNRERWADPEYRQQRLEHQRNRYHTDEVFRTNAQLDRGYRRAVKAGVQAERITAEELLTCWSEKGIDPLRCIYTGEALTPQNRSLDHCTPISRGGSHTVDNIVPCSWQANDNKRSRTALEYMADRAAAQDPEDLPPLVQRALSTSVPARAKRTVVVQIEEGADNE